MDIKLVNYSLLSQEEHKALLLIRNSSHVRLGTNDNRKIEMKDHLAWVRRLKKDNTKVFYAVVLDQVVVGGVNLFDKSDKETLWGLFFEKGVNPFISSYTACLLIDRAFNYFNLNRMNLEVNSSNENAYKFDLHLGFKTYGEKYYNDELFYTMCLYKEDWNINKKLGMLKVIYNKANSTDFQFIEKELE